MENIEYFLGCIVIIWGMFVGYLGFLHSSIRRMRSELEVLRTSRSEE